MNTESEKSFAIFPFGNVAALRASFLLCRVHLSKRHAPRDFDQLSQRARWCGQAVRGQAPLLGLMLLPTDPTCTSPILCVFSGLLPKASKHSLSFYVAFSMLRCHAARHGSCEIYPLLLMWPEHVSPLWVSFFFSIKWAHINLWAITSFCEN